MKRISELVCKAVFWILCCQMPQKFALTHAHKMKFFLLQETWKWNIDQLFRLLMAYFATNFAPKIGHVFPEWLFQNVVDIQDGDTYGWICPCCVSLLSKQSGFVKKWWRHKWFNIYSSNFRDKSTFAAKEFIKAWHIVILRFSADNSWHESCPRYDLILGRACIHFVQVLENIISLKT